MNWIKPSADYHYLHVGEWFAEMKLLMGCYWYGRLSKLSPGKEPNYEWEEIGGQGMLRCRLFIEYFDPNDCEKAYTGVQRVLEECILSNNNESEFLNPNKPLENKP